MLCFKSARELTAMVAEREVSVEEVMGAHLAQIEQLNPKVNAICTLVADQALERSKKMDQELAQGAQPGPLQGLPVAIKDLNETKGIRTTYGSRIYREYVPDHDALLVERLKAAGAIVIGKTNTPEFGAGSQTFNEVFGITRNPYDLSKTPGGSSGGAAAALASGMIPIADGSDLGGSLRNPANFNNVVGLRPSPGCIPCYPRNLAWNTLSVLGPMARSVSDVALLLAAMAGADGRDPISYPLPAVGFDRGLHKDFKGARLAWGGNLGQFPVQQSVMSVLESALPKFADLDCEVEEAHPDFTGAAEIFHTLRAYSFAAEHADDVKHHRELIKDTVVWNVEEGLKLNALQVSDAQMRRTTLYHRIRGFFDDYDFLLLPVSQVAPFDVEIEWIEEIDGTPMHTYIDWLKSCSLITLTEHPAISVPCGFTPEGLPVGIQIVGPHRGEEKLLGFAHAVEQLFRPGFSPPPLALDG